MWRGRALWSLWAARRARRAATEFVRPFLQRSSRLRGPLASANWSDPYVAGFVTTLITTIAREASGGLDEGALGLVQLESWSQLTHVDPAMIGERILSLSLAEDADFALGCRNALIFRRTLLQSETEMPLAAEPVEPERAQLWDQMIGDRLVAGG